MRSCIPFYVWSSSDQTFALSSDLVPKENLVYALKKFEVLRKNVTWLKPCLTRIHCTRCQRIKIRMIWFIRTKRNTYYKVSVDSEYGFSLQLFFHEKGALRDRIYSYFRFQTKSDTIHDYNLIKISPFILLPVCFCRSWKATKTKRNKRANFN